jgi:hypothetical protein
MTHHTANKSATPTSHASPAQQHQSAQHLHVHQTAPKLHNSRCLQAARGLLACALALFFVPQHVTGALQILPIKPHLPCTHSQDAPLLRDSKIPAVDAHPMCTTGVTHSSSRTGMRPRIWPNSNTTQGGKLPASCKHPTAAACRGAPNTSSRPKSDQAQTVCSTHNHTPTPNQSPNPEQAKL